MKVGRFGLGFKSVFHMTGKQSGFLTEFHLPFMQVLRAASPDLVRSMKSRCTFIPPSFQSKVVCRYTSL